MGKHDARCDWLLVTLALAALLGGCLNPRPEELPSSIEPAGGAADTPVATAAPAAPGVENAGSPTGSSPDGEREAPSAPAPQSAPPALDDSAPEPPDAGADAASGSADAADAG